MSRLCPSRAEGAPCLTDRSEGADCIWLGGALPQVVRARVLESRVPESEAQLDPEPNFILIRGLSPNQNSRA